MKNKKNNEIVVYLISLLAFAFLIFIAIYFQTTTPYNKVALDLGFAKIAWYAVFILTGLIIAVVWSIQEFRLKGIKEDFLFDALFWSVPLAIIGSRIYYVIFDPVKDYNTILDILDVTRGGLSIHGVVITVFVFLIFYSKKKNVNFWLIMDIVAVGFLLGQIVGRWGNFMNQEAYGPAIESTTLLNIIPTFIKDQMFINGFYHHPTFLYEGIWNTIGLILILIIRRKRIFKVGDHFALYLIWYGFGRGLIIEPLRIGGAQYDALRFLGLPVNVYLSIILFFIGGLFLIYFKNKYNPNLGFYKDISRQGKWK